MFWYNATASRCCVVNCVNVGNDGLCLVLARGHFIYVRALLLRFLFSSDDSVFTQDGPVGFLFEFLTEEDGV